RPKQVPGGISLINFGSVQQLCRFSGSGPAHWKTRSRFDSAPWFVPPRIAFSPKSRWPSNPGSGLQNRLGGCNSRTGLHFPSIGVDKIHACLPSRNTGSDTQMLKPFAPIEFGLLAETSHGRSNGRTPS